jgi:polyphenol oxidase
MSAMTSALLRSAGFRHGFSVRPLDFRVDRASDEALAIMLRLPIEKIFRASQVHGTRAVVVDRRDVVSVAKEEADALIATEANSAVGVRIADCVPILLADSKTGAVAAVHAGWRGLVAGVIESALDAHAFDLAAIGPCIGVCCFEIGEDVARKLAPHVKGTHGDLRAAARARLVARNMQNAHIDDVAGCTMCDETFHSHRRDGDRAGRNFAVISTKANDERR